VTPTLPRVLLVDLDDTILRFSAGQPNFWRLALERQLPERADHAALLTAVESVSHTFWSDAGRAFWGRQNMFEARRHIAVRALAEARVSTRLCERIADEMTEQKEAHVRPFEGAIEALRALQTAGHRLGLLTNGCSRFQRRKLARFELEPLFELILIEGELGYGKPDSRVFAAALDHFGVRAGATWMIGDNLEADIAGAQALGIFGVWHDAHAAGLPAACACVPGHVIRNLAELAPA
jgi:HAD superfamily hydrolase (TIGR01549 family)